MEIILSIVISSVQSKLHRLRPMLCMGDIYFPRQLKGTPQVLLSSGLKRLQILKCGVADDRPPTNLSTFSMDNTYPQLNDDKVRPLNPVLSSSTKSPLQNPLRKSFPRSSPHWIFNRRTSSFPNPWPRLRKESSTWISSPNTPSEQSMGWDKIRHGKTQ
jgi:hypothetical protein